MGSRLDAISQLQSWSRRQGVGSQLAIGPGGWITPDSPGQPCVLLQGPGLAEAIQGPVEMTMAWGFAFQEQHVSALHHLAALSPALTREECSPLRCLPPTHTRLSLGCISAQIKTQGWPGF